MLPPGLSTGDRACGFVSARASKYNRTETSGPLRGRQDADHREGTGEDMQAAVAGGNMLVTI